MADLRLVLTLLLLTVLHCTEQVPDVFVKEEDDAILTCDKVQDGQDKCDRTSWIFSNPKTSNPAAEIIRLGQITPEYSFISDRLGVTENCSLVIKKVQLQEFGRYSCLQFDQSGRQVSDAPVMLTFVSLREHNDSSEVRLNCFVFSLHHCTALQVKWIYNNAEFKSDHPSIIKKEHPCGLSFSFLPAYYLTLRTELFTCEVRHENNKHQFKLSPEQPEDVSNTSADFKGGWWFFVVKSLSWTALIITTVVTCICTRDTKRQRSSSEHFEMTSERPLGPGNTAAPADYENQP